MPYSHHPTSALRIKLCSASFILPDTHRSDQYEGLTSSPQDHILRDCEVSAPIDDLHWKHRRWWPSQNIWCSTCTSTRWNDMTNRQLLTALKARAQVVEVTAKPNVIQAIDTDPDAIFVTDGAICHSGNRFTVHNLATYTCRGGTLVLGGLMSAFLKPSDLNAIMKEAWKLQWRFGVYQGKPPD